MATPIMPTNKSTKSRKSKPPRSKAAKSPSKTVPRKSSIETRELRRKQRITEVQQFNAAEQAAVRADQKRRGVSWLDEIIGCFEGDEVFARISELGAALRRADRSKG